MRLSPVERRDSNLPPPTTTANTSSSSISFSANPSLKLLGQIILLQFFYYLTGTSVFFITSQLLGWTFDSSWIFSWSIISIENSLGLTLMFLWLLCTLLQVIFITFIIGRSKLVWDFAFTIHFLNFIIVWFVSGFPKNIYWWILQILSLILMMLLSTYTTRWLELRDTFFEDSINADIELGSVNSK